MPMRNQKIFGSAEKVGYGSVAESALINAARITDGHSTHGHQIDSSSQQFLISSETAKKAQ